MSELFYINSIVNTDNYMSWEFRDAIPVLSYCLCFFIQSTRTKPVVLNRGLEYKFKNEPQSKTNKSNLKKKKKIKPK